VTASAARTGSRHRAREAALQMLYQWEVGRVEPAVALTGHWAIEQDEAKPVSAPARRFAEQLATGTIAHLAEIDALLTKHAQNWRLERMAIIDRLILRLAVHELLYVPETSPAVVIDEALELARTFSEEDAVRFVNGVLDAVHKNLPGTGQ